MRCQDQVLTLEDGIQVPVEEPDGFHKKCSIINESVVLRHVYCLSIYPFRPKCAELLGGLHAQSFDRIHAAEGGDPLHRVLRRHRLLDQRMGLLGPPAGRQPDLGDRRASAEVFKAMANLRADRSTSNRQLNSDVPMDPDIEKYIRDIRDAEMPAMSTRSISARHDGIRRNRKRWCRSSTACSRRVGTSRRNFGNRWASRRRSAARHSPRSTWTR